VPQGSVLGPLLFLAHVNDSWRNSESNTQLFTDDCIIYKKTMDSRDIDKLQTDLNRLREWAVKNEMKINPSKSNAVCFTRARVKERIRYYFGDQLILEVSSFNNYHYKQRFKLGRSCQLHTTKGMEDTSFHNVYTQKGK